MLSVANQCPIMHICSSSVAEVKRIPDVPCRTSASLRLMAEILEASSRKRKLAAILHADVVGFSRLMGEDEAGTHRALGELRRAVDPLIAASGGRIVGTAGDSLLADFSSVVDALNCAIEMQRGSAGHQRSDPA